MKIVVFTDLDATLLDSDTYSWAPATESLQALREFDASVILVSSKTFAEMESLHRELELHDPFVIENGGGIFFRRESSVLSHISELSRHPVREYGDFVLLSLGTEYEGLVRSLAEISESLGLPLRGFSTMTDGDVADFTGLDIEAAARARKRLFDEPFLIQGTAAGRESGLRRIAASKGLTAVQGGRFWHLMGHAGKGAATAMLIQAYRNMYDNVFTIGLGDSPNDFPFLEVVDCAVLVGAGGKSLDLPDALRDARQTDLPGARGWNQAVLGLLHEIRNDGFRPFRATAEDSVGISVNPHGRGDHN